jgi:hypothetical protein
LENTRNKENRLSGRPTSTVQPGAETSPSPPAGQSPSHAGRGLALAVVSPRRQPFSRRWPSPPTSTAHSPDHDTILTATVCATYRFTHLPTAPPRRQRKRVFSSPPASTLIASLLSIECSAVVDEQPGQASTGAMDSSLASTPLRGGRPQGVRRAMPRAPEKPPPPQEAPHRRTMPPATVRPQACLPKL